jgi:5-hydroxyisourate hydrolase
MSHITTHVLDTARGCPAAGVVVVLEQAVGDPPILATSTTDEDGRVTELGPARLEPRVYRLRFNTGGYFADHETPSFYPEVVVSIEVSDAEHYHVPLLLSPFGYSTYRGS